MVAAFDARRSTLLYGTTKLHGLYPTLAHGSKTSHWHCLGHTLFNSIDLPAKLWNGSQKYFPIGKEKRHSQTGAKRPSASRQLARRSWASDLPVSEWISGRKAGVTSTCPVQKETASYCTFCLEWHQQGVGVDHSGARYNICLRLFTSFGLSWNRYCLRLFICRFVGGTEISLTF